MEMWWLGKVEVTEMAKQKQVLCRTVLGQMEETEAECPSALAVCACDSTQL